MAQKSIYPIGIQTFEQIIKGGYLYVDKTALVYDLVKSNKYVFLNRPRRFGKSLLVSTLEAYFQGRKELFEGLAISTIEKDWAQYPVFRFDLSGESYQHLQKLVSKIDSALSAYEKIYGNPPEGKSIADRFDRLIKKARQVNNQEVVVLIDEYDKPLTDSLHDDSLHDDLRKELEGFYGVLKSNDSDIRFALLTGITKFGHVSVFFGSEQPERYLPNRRL